MFESFQVGASFTIINRASPVLATLTREIRALKVEAQEAHVALMEIGKGVNITGLTRRVTALNDALGKTSAVTNSLRTSMVADFQAMNVELATAAASARELNVALRGVRLPSAAGGGAGRGGGRRGGGGIHMRGHVPLGAGMGASLLGGPALGALALGAAGAAGTAFAAEEQQSIMYAVMGANINPNSATGQGLAGQLKAQSQRASKGTVFSFQETASILPALVNMMLQPENGTGTSIEKIMPLIYPISRFAETESMFSKSIGQDWGLQESAIAAAQFSHLGGGYAPEQLSKFLNVLAPVSIASERSPGQLVTASKYLLPMSNALGFDPTGTAEMVGLMTVMGQTGSTAGTGLRQALYGMLKEGTGATYANQIAKALGPLAVGGSAKGSERSSALRALGFIDGNGKSGLLGPDGKPSWDRFIGLAQTDQAKFGTNLPNELSKVLSIRGAQSFLAAAAPNAGLLWSAEKAKVGAFPGVDQFQSMAAQGSTVQQWHQSMANIENTLNLIATNTGLLQGVTDALKGLNAFLLRMQAWMAPSAVAPSLMRDHAPIRRGQNPLPPIGEWFSSPAPRWQEGPDGSFIHKESFITGGGGSGGGINININGAGDPAEVARQVALALAKMLGRSMLNNQGGGEGTMHSPYASGTSI